MSMLTFALERTNVLLGATEDEANKDNPEMRSAKEPTVPNLTMPSAIFISVFF